MIRHYTEQEAIEAAQEYQAEQSKLETLQREQHEQGLAKQLAGVSSGAATLVSAPEASANANPNILEEVANFIRRFVFLRDDVLYDLLAAWVIATHLSGLFEYFGYIFAHSPEPQSGKSRLLEVLNVLVHSSSGILVSPTEAVLFRTGANSTQLLDEVDSWSNKEDLRGVLNAGFQQNGTVTRMAEKRGNYHPQKYSVYGPRALAGIGTTILNPATKDRTFMFEMVRQTKGERRERWHARRIESTATTLKSLTVQWCQQNKQRVQDVYDAELAIGLDHFRDRTIDIAQPLASILEVAYAESPDLLPARSRLLRAIELTRDEEAKPQHDVLKQLLQLAELEDPLIGTASELFERCKQLLMDPPSTWEISATLGQFGFKTKSHRKNGGEPRKRYELPKIRLVELLQRYGGEQPMAATLRADGPWPEAQEAKNEAKPV